MGIDPNDPEYGEIGLRAQRAVNPMYATNPKDARHRARKREQLQRELTLRGHEYFRHALPGFGPEQLAINGEYYALNIDANALERLAIKIVKGLAYIYDNKTFIGQSHKFDVKHLAGSIPDISDMIQRYGGGADRGPAIRSEWAYVKDDPASRVHYISVWERWSMYVFATPKER